MKKTYIAQFSFGEAKRGTNRTYAAAWAIFKDENSQTPLIGFARDHALAEKQIRQYRNNRSGRNWTGPSEIVPALEVVK